MKTTTLPAGSPAETPAHPQIHAWHKLGISGFVRAGQLARAVKGCRAMPGNTWLRRTLSGWEGTAGDVLHQFSRYCADEINRRGGLTMPDQTRAREARVHRMLCAKGRPSECRWCGRALPRFEFQPGARFCDAGCRKSHNS